MNRIRAGSLVLEPQIAAHASEMFDVLSDPAIYEFENSPPVSVAWLTDRFRRLESRVSPDRAEQWLNWVVRLPTGALAGYVQATIAGDRTAHIAYELASRFWRQGIGTAAVSGMLDELAATYDVCTLSRDAQERRWAGCQRGRVRSFSAWKRARGAYILGAALVPLGAAGNVSDPDFQFVHEAKQLKKREEDNPGDPPNDEEESP